MSIITASVLGLSAVLLAVQLKGKGGEYGIYIVMAAGLLLFFYGAGKLRIILDTARRIGDYVYRGVCLGNLPGRRVRGYGNPD